MQGLVIRDAVAADIRPMAKLHLEAWKVAYAPILHQDHLDWATLERTVRAKRNHLKNEAVILVAEIDERLVGFLIYEFDHPDDDEIPPGTWDIHSFWMDPQWTRQGIGEALLQEMIRRASPRRIHVWVLTGVRAGPAFYEKHGFRPDEQTRQDFIFLDHPLPMVRYVKQLRSNRAIRKKK